MFEENGDTLNTTEIYDMLLTQKQKDGKLYKKTPTKRSLSQTLARQPEFANIGVVDKVVNGLRVRATLWKRR